MIRVVEGEGSLIRVAHTHENKSPYCLDYD